MIFLALALVIGQAVNAPPALPITITSGATTYFVDGASGGDGNACTATGQSACKTINGVLAKLPHTIAHAVTISVAAGTYAETPRVLGFNIQSIDPTVAPSAALTIQGALANTTVTTGTASGTATGYSNTYGSGTRATLTDSTQSWTTNDLRGALLEIVSGTGSGQRVAIAGNSSTAIQLSYPFIVDPTAGSTYAIKIPSVIITGGTTLIQGITGSGTVTLDQLTLSPSGQALSVRNVRGTVAVTNSKLVGGGTSSGVLVGDAGGFTLSNAIVGGRGHGVSVNSVLLPMSIGPLALLNTLIYCTGASCTGSGIFIQPGVTISTLQATIVGNWATGLTLAGSFASYTAASGFWIDCGSTNMTGIYIPEPRRGISAQGGGGITFHDGPDITGCGVAFEAGAPGQSLLVNPVLTGNTVGLKLYGGARVKMTLSTTFTGNGTDIDVEGTTSSLAAFEALSPIRMVGAEGTVLRE